MSLPRSVMGCYVICGCIVSVAFHDHTHLTFDITTLVFVPRGCTVLPAKIDSDFMFCLQSYQGLIIDSSLVY